MDNGQTEVVDKLYTLTEKVARTILVNLRKFPHDQVDDLVKYFTSNLKELNPSIPELPKELQKENVN